MAVDIGMRKPANAIIARGRPPIIQTLTVETATNCKPGRLVKKDTTDADVEQCARYGSPVGWLGFEDSAPSVRENASGLNGSVDGTYAAADEAAVLSGGGFVIVASLKANQVCNKGDYAVPAASGEVRTWASGETIVGKFMESLTDTGSSQDVMVLSMI